MKNAARYGAQKKPPHTTTVGWLQPAVRAADSTSVPDRPLPSL